MLSETKHLCNWWRFPKFKQTTEILRFAQDDSRSEESRPYYTHKRAFQCLSCNVFSRGWQDHGDSHKNLHGNGLVGPLRGPELPATEGSQSGLIHSSETSINL